MLAELPASPSAPRCSSSSHRHHLSLLRQYHAAVIKSGLSFNPLIKHLADSRFSQAALSLFSTAPQTTPVPDPSAILAAVKASAHLEAAYEGKQVHSLVLKHGLFSDVFIQASLISFYSKVGDLGSAQKVFDRVPVRDLVAWNALIDGYVRNGQVELANGLFDRMPKRDAFSWASLMNGYAKRGDMVKARELFDRMPDKNIVSWNVMIDGYMKNGQFGLAGELFHRMPHRNVISWNSMISGFAKNGLLKEAINVYDAMVEEGVERNIVTMVGVLFAVSGLALLERGKLIHEYIRNHEFSLDGVLGTCLIDMYSKCGSIENALDVFHGISRKKLGHWTAIIVGLGVHGKAAQVFELFQEMQRLGMRPSAITFVGVLNACSHAGLVDEGRQYFELMSKEYSINPTVEHYGCLVDMLCRVGQLEGARNTIDKMPMKPNKVIWMSLLSGCRKFANIEIGEFAAKCVIELDPLATGCYVLLSNMYAAAGLWDKVSKLRGIMKERGVRKDPGCSYVEYDGKVHEFVVADRSHPQAEVIYSKLSEMRERLKLAGYIPDMTQVLLYVEEKEKEAELARHSERLAIAFGLINLEPGRPIRIVKNLRVCNDCHNVTKLLSGIYGREIIVRDNSRFHHFRGGSCSCMDYW